MTGGGKASASQPWVKSMALNYSGSLKNRGLENSLVVQQSGLSDFTAKAPGSIPGQGINFAGHMTRSEKKRESRFNLSVSSFEI